MNIGDERCDISYNHLPAKLRLKVDYLSISVVEIKISNQEKKDEILHKIFANLNSGGEKLSPQELRNGIYPCAFNRAMKKINEESEIWRKLWGTINDKCKDLEMLYRLSALKTYVVYAKKEYKIEAYGNSTTALIDKFAEKSFSFHDEKIVESVNSLEQFISRLNISRTYFLKTALIEGLYISKNFFRDSTADGTTGMANMNKRWKGIYGVLSKYDQ